MPKQAPLKNQVLSSLKWVAMGKIVTQMLRWAMTFWVIRILSPDDYGVVAMSAVLFGFFNIVLSSLFTSSIIQQKDLSESALKQIFGAILLSHAAFFLIQYGVADPVAAYYQSSTVSEVLKVNAWCFVFLAFEVIPAALLAKNMEFKQVSLIAATSNITAAVATLVMAYSDFGLWSLVYGELINIVLRCVLTFITKPTLFLPSFRVHQIHGMLRFGGLLSILSMLFYVFTNMDVAIGGKIMTPTEIGLYAIGLQVALTPQKKIMPLLRQVAFPAYAQIQDQSTLISKYVLKVQRLCIGFTLPIFWGLASVIDVVIPLLLGEKWQGAIIPTAIMLIIMPLRFSEELFGPALKSLRRVKHMLINLCIMIFIMFISIHIGARFGATGLAFAWLSGYPLGYVIVAWRNSRILNTPFNLLIKCFIPPMLAGAGMLAMVYLIKLISLQSLALNLIVQIAVGGLSYLMLINMLDKNSVKEAVALVRNKGN
ncbi:oligosaccharide flippase family protein [Agarivorans sp.]|uniref:oligosaccharide flippase family protein n=1 Tax=Agarivorans sp. TaxID=1872412 RepID=UPI003D040E23